MPNNQAQDRYNPPGTKGDDWEKEKFSDINNGTLFWLNTTPQWDDRANGYVNEAYSKLDDKQALNTANQIVLDVLSNIDVYTKI